MTRWEGPSARIAWRRGRKRSRGADRSRHPGLGATPVTPAGATAEPYAGRWLSAATVSPVPGSEPRPQLGGVPDHPPDIVGRGKLPEAHGGGVFRRAVRDCSVRLDGGGVRGDPPLQHLTGYCGRVVVHIGAFQAPPQLVLCLLAQ